MIQYGLVVDCHETILGIGIRMWPARGHTFPDRLFALRPGQRSSHRHGGSRGCHEGPNAGEITNVFSPIWQAVAPRKVTVETTYWGKL
jgi:hypothetical protein